MFLIVRYSHVKSDTYRIKCYTYFGIIYGGDTLVCKKKTLQNDLVLSDRKKGASARDMSLSLGQNAGYINNIENGHNLPSMTVFFYICEYLGITPKEFFDYDNESPDTTRQLLEALTKIDKETLVHLTAIVMALSKK